MTECDDGVLLVKCHSGWDCTADRIMAAIGLDLTFLYPSDYARACNRGRGRLRARPRPAGGQAPDPNADPDARLRGLLAEARRAAAGRLRELADELRLRTAALRALRVGYRNGRWVFPERDDRRRLIGLTYRDRDGGKRAEPGGLRGLTLPRGGFALPGPVHLCEGATDAAAMHAVGACAVGRPAASTSRAVRGWLAALLRRHPGRDVIVVGDRDRKAGGARPGQEGARELAAMMADDLGRAVRWALPQPPFKDVREQVAAGAWGRGLVEKGVPA